ncbi:MAG: hypothetical protein ABSF26_16685 [Thermoguttaceae bacterium]
MVIPKLGKTGNGSFHRNGRNISVLSAAIGLAYPCVGDSIFVPGKRKGVSVSRVISCPQCQRKLSVRSEFQGRRLACPKCKATFEVPEESGSDPADDPTNELAIEPESGETDFFADLSSASLPVKKPAAAKAKTARARAKPAPRTVAAPGRQKSKARSLKAWYIGGGVAAMLLVALAIVLLYEGETSGGGSVKWGLGEGTRCRIYHEMIRAIDAYGMGDTSKKEWKRIAADEGIDMDIMARILDEGFDPKCKWLLPEFANYDAEKKAHRMEWIKARIQTHGEPMFHGH